MQITPGLMREKINLLQVMLGNEEITKLELNIKLCMFQTTCAHCK